MRNQRAQSLVELLVVIGLMALLLPALFSGFMTARQGKAQQYQRLTASAILKETEEAVRNIRDNNEWPAFAVNGTYHPVIVGSHWSLATGSAVLNSGFSRQLLIEDVYRNTAGTMVISPTPGTLDFSTKKITITVSWTTPRTTTLTSTLYLTRHTNQSYSETVQSEFNDATASKTNVKVQASAPLPTPTPDDGEIVLSQTGGYGDWCNPGSILTSLDLPKNGVANSLSAIIGKAAVGTGDNASGASYAGVSINDPPFPTPPNPVTAGTFNTTYKTNGAFTDNQYAYIATDTNGKQGVIIRLSDYQAIAYLNIGTGSVKGQSIFATNNIAYLTGTDNILHTFNLSNLGSCTPSSICTYSTDYGNVALGGLGNKVIVVNSKAYVAVNTTTNQLQIIDVSDPQHLPMPTKISVNGQGAKDIFVNEQQSRAYLVTAQSSTQPEFFLIDLGTGQVLGNYDTHNDGNGDMSPKGVVAVSGAKVILVGTGGREYEVLRVDGNYETAPAYCGGRDVDTGINGIATVFTKDTTNRAFSYIITPANPEFIMFEGGPGGTGAGDYVPSGTFISRPFPINVPLVNNTAFNSFYANVYQPIVNVPGGFYGVQLQIAVANPVNGSCNHNSYTFVGTDSTGTGPTHYFVASSTGSVKISGSIPFDTYTNYTNPAKCFKYKVILNTNDSTLTPVFKDFTVNFSP